VRHPPRIWKSGSTCTFETETLPEARRFQRSFPPHQTRLKLADRRTWSNPNLRHVAESRHGSLTVSQRNPLRDDVGQAGPRTDVEPKPWVQQSRSTMQQPHKMR
jgi:hypothetical protein